MQLLVTEFTYLAYYPFNIPLLWTRKDIY
jgi:hypothetical protein